MDLSKGGRMLKIAKRIKRFGKGDGRSMMRGILIIGLRQSSTCTVGLVLARYLEVSKVSLRKGAPRVKLMKTGWLSLADNGPRRGTLELCPDIKLTTAYLLLRPFFDQYGKLDMDSTYFYGADPGMGHVLKDSWHPALQMNKTMISAPEATPGDYVFWHCDVSLFKS
jgi:hypothetical protein